jgi:hypothetical protein
LEGGMHRVIPYLLLLAALCAVPVLHADENSEAEALASAGQEFFAKGKTETAREYLFKALFHNPNCAAALYELGKIYQAEGNPAAASDFFSRALHEMKNLENSRPDFGAKITDARLRLQVVNPYAAQFNTAMENYSEDLGRIVKRSNDSITNEEVGKRVQLLSLASYVPASKLPEIQKPAVAKTDTRARRPFEKDTAPVTTVVPPDVERALKGAGWTTITGVWKKKSEGVYEVTDGKLETMKLNGALQFTVSGSGTASAFVRNGNKDPWEHFTGGSTSGSNSGSGSSGSGMGRFQFVSGYGVSVCDRECKAYSPQGGWGNGNEYYPGFDHSTTLAAQPKHLVMITVQEKENGKGTALNAQVDGKNVVNCNYKLNKDGPFTIEIKGTVIIEDPKAIGQ